jgi:hypothetical protein
MEPGYLEEDQSFEVEPSPAVSDDVEGDILDVLPDDLEEVQEEADHVGLPEDTLEVERAEVPEDLIETDIEEDITLETPLEHIEESPPGLVSREELEFIETLLREKPPEPEPEELPTDVSPPTLDAEPEEAVPEEETLDTEEESPQPPSLAVTGLLPGDALKDTHWARVTPEELMEEVKLLMQALGYPEAETLSEPDEKGGDLLAWREKEGHIKKVLVRCVRSTKNVGVRQGRSLIKSMEAREDCLGAYLVATSDFTQSCRNLASESGGKLDLVSGAEFYRHLHILGRS